MKVITVVGARPQFIKAATVSRAIKNHNQQGGNSIDESIVHTGQHFDHNMSSVFFEELDIPRPVFSLDIHGGSHGEMTGRMLGAIERVLIEEKPDWVLIYGDTNSTLAGALAAAKLHLPVAHVEAGLRSFNRRMPEEINRIVADRICNLLLCPTDEAIKNLRSEGLAENACNVGDVMYDAVLYYREKARLRHPLEKWALQPKSYALCTIHRAENTDNPQKLAEILRAIQQIARDIPVVFPVHPRTKKLLINDPIVNAGSNLRLIEPVSYMEMLRLESDAYAILTDSGGIQKEAYFHHVPCLTLRDETEWVETIASGRNTLCGADYQRIIEGWEMLGERSARAEDYPYGNGQASTRIVEELLRK